MQEKLSTIAIKEYIRGEISLQKLAEKLSCNFEQVKILLAKEKISLDLGCETPPQLERDIDNA